ncbi:MAG TPA: serine/threonine-protein kinase [Candidatus Acidoferrum sp.]|nr:serine/threonine-protein kinase [Candidatus Acidoferrum sp.]
MIAPTSRKIGKYEILHKLGRGGMADVYLALDTEHGHQVALKLIEHAADPDTHDSIEAERRGAQLQAHLARIDPRVVRVYDAGDADGYFFVAMEYIDGQDLAELMRRGPLATGFAVDVAAKVARTLENAHGLQVGIGGKDFHGIVHGDIKPKNIRIDARGEVRVLDFGIAKALSLSRRLTRNEFGSVPYASPERLDTGDVDPSSDLWSLGVMLYEMLAGSQPFTAPGTEQLERLIRARTPAAPLPDAVPEALRRIVMHALAPDPSARYASAIAFTADLDAFREGRPIAAAASMAADPDATRRTSRTVEQPTTRTSAPATVRSATSSAATTRPKKPVSTLRFTVRVVLVMIACSLVYGSWVLVGDYRLYQSGQQLLREVESEQLTDLDAMYTRWGELSKGNPSSVLLYGARKAVKQRLLAAADHVIDTYRTSEQPVYVKDWERARVMASRALAVEPDNAARGRLRLAEGHLARINGTTHRNASDLRLAVEKFTDAQQLMPHSPDPQLGLARVYVYGLKDLDKAYDALGEAQRRGYQMGNREKGQLADGYRDRADRLAADSKSIKGLPAEKDQLQRAADDYKHAMEIYQQIAPWGNANGQIRRVRDSLDEVNFRLMQIESQGH